MGLKGDSCHPRHDRRWSPKLHPRTPGRPVEIVHDTRGTRCAHPGVHWGLRLGLRDRLGQLPLTRTICVNLPPRPTEKTLDSSKLRSSALLHGWLGPCPGVDRCMFIGRGDHPGASWSWGHPWMGGMQAVKHPQRSLISDSAGSLCLAPCMRSKSR